MFALYGVDLSEARPPCSSTDCSSFVIPALLGVPAFVLLRRTLMHADKPAAMCAPLGLDVVKIPARTTS